MCTHWATPSGCSKRRNWFRDKRPSAVIDLLSRQYLRYGLLPGMVVLLGPAAFLRAAGVFNGIGRVHENHHAGAVGFRPLRNLLGNLDRRVSLRSCPLANFPLTIDRTGL